MFSLLFSICVAIDDCGLILHECNHSLQMAMGFFFISHLWHISISVYINVPHFFCESRTNSRTHTRTHAHTLLSPLWAFAQLPGQAPLGAAFLQCRSLKAHAPGPRPFTAGSRALPQTARGAVTGLKGRRALAAVGMCGGPAHTCRRCFPPGLVTLVLVGDFCLGCSFPKTFSVCS